MKHACECRQLQVGFPSVRFVENAVWVEQNFGTCDLGNKLRNKRLNIVASNMLEAPSASLCQQNPNWSDTKAAYRIWDRAEVTFDAVADCHWKQTRETRPGRYLLISDTSDIDHYTHVATEGLGMLGSGTGRGMQLHSCLFVDSSNQVVVGIGGAELYYRQRVRKGETRTQSLARLRESQLWGNTVAKVGRAPSGSQWIHVFDRGGDNYEALLQIKQCHCDWVIRVAKLERKVLDSQGQELKLKAALEQAIELGSYQLNLRSRNGVAARTATLKVSSIQITVPRPKLASKAVKNSDIQSIQTGIVIVREIGAPKGVKPIEWVLMTSLPTQTFDQAWQVIDDYENRWIIEEYHKVIKTGCSIERHALRTKERLEGLTSLVAVIGVRLLQLKTFSKHKPETKAANRIPPLWLAALKALKPKISITTLTVYQFFRELAKLGGFLARKHDGEPGWQTIWRGYDKFHRFTEGFEHGIARAKRG